MSVLPPDLPRLRTLVTYLRGELGRAERALIAAEEAELAGLHRGGRAGDDGVVVDVPGQVARDTGARNCQGYGGRHCREGAL